ncbi:hypothetical protein SLEP1_g18774 [Rubroshorea leprosula]|uniref:Uncharacterized protein n=1 Tax=Rubroshorea leprosula TaxID=152421 RepID=A0AAV5J4J3_9ROSI|nr:hypothetical protein SLEP1_g18774 [Rubroshorea leprosula]
MDEFVGAAGGLRIPKKPRKKSKTSTVAEKGVTEGGLLSSTSARAVEVQPRPEHTTGGSEDVVEFVPRSSSPEVNPEERERGEVEVRDLGGGRERTPPHVCQKSLFEATNKTGAKHFLNATLPEVDRVRAKDEVVSHARYTIVRHALESASWTNALAQEYAESVRDRASLQRQCDQLQREKDKLQKGKVEWEKQKKEMQRRLDEVLPSVTELQNENDVLSTKLGLEERKRKICEEKLEAQDKYMDKMRSAAAELKKNVNLLVHNGMEEHIGNFLNSSTFEDILKLYRLPTAIVAFTDCRKKVKA